MAELPEAKAAGEPAITPAGKPFGRELKSERPARPWVRRAEAIAVLALLLVFLAWVGVIILRQRQAGRDLHWIHGQGAVCLIDINRAEAPELMLLPGVGPSKAERIIKWRQEHGPFHEIEELQKAAGISARELAAMRSLVTLGALSPEPEENFDFRMPDDE